MRRVQSVRIDSPRLWGKMSPHQMICHLGDVFRLYMGEMPAQPAALPVPVSLARVAALKSPIRWPKGFKSATEIDQEIDGTPPTLFDANITDLKNLIAQFTKQPRDFSRPRKSAFRVSLRTRMDAVAYLHCDHHLRQFSC